MNKEKKLTGYPSIDKPWLKQYTEGWTSELIPQKTVYRNILLMTHWIIESILLFYVKFFEWLKQI